MVFYHRIIECHCLVEMEAHELGYTDVAQLNLYFNYYKKNDMQADDNTCRNLIIHRSRFRDVRVCHGQYE